MKKIRAGLIALFLLYQGHAAATQSLDAVDIVSGKPVHLQQYKKQTVLLAFFSAGCDACVYNFKLIREFYKANKKSHFAVIGIGLDKKPDHFKNYAQLVNATTPKDEQFPLVWRNSPQHKDSFGEIKRDPSLVVIDKHGNITLKREGVIQDNDWDEIWASLQ